ncbi:hypothetical protein MHU86_7888 [Fragilaria crotonensis]|nr:hypothetical protein MHU86_7888 [Fragilaria crotonensis]
MADIQDVALEAEPFAEAPDQAPVVGLNPVHNVLALCGVASAAAQRTFIEIDGLDTIADAFATLNGDNDVTEMAKRMASRSSVATGRVILGTMQIKRFKRWCSG